MITAETTDTSTVETPEADPFEESRAAFNQAVGTVETQKPDAIPKPDAAKPDGDFPEELLGGEKKVPEKKEEDDIPTPEFRSPEKRKHWDQLKGRFVETRTKLEAAEARLKELEAKSQSVDSTKYEEELKTERQRRAEMEEKLERTAFTQSPKYQGYVEREKGTLEAAKGYLDGSEINPRIIDLAAEQKPADRLKTLTEANMDATTIAAIMPYLAQADSIRSDREKALASYKEEMAQDAAAQAQQQTAAEARDREQQSAIFQKVNADVAKKYPVFQKVDGHDKWNAVVDKMNADAKSFWEGGHSDEELAEVAHKAAGYEPLFRLYTAVLEQSKELRAQISKLTAQQPQVNGSAKDGRQSVDPNAPVDFDSQSRAIAEAAFANARQ